MKPSCSRSLVLSRISWASRTRVRSISEALMSCAFSRVRGIELRRNRVACVDRTIPFRGRRFLSLECSALGRELHCPRALPFVTVPDGISDPRSNDLTGGTGGGAPAADRESQSYS